MVQVLPHATIGTTRTNNFAGVTTMYPVPVRREHVLTTLFFIPSFYGVVGWGFWLLIYLVGDVDWYPPTSEALMIFLGVEVVFIFSLLVSLPLYRGLRLHARAVRQPRAPIRLVAGFALVGAIGLGMYYAHLSDVFGGIELFFNTLLSSSYEIRWSNQDSTSVGVQISYFGWTACALIVFYRRQRLLGPLWWLVFFALLVGNLSFIDRTRPFWILFTSMMMVLVAPPLPRFKQIVVVLGGVSSVLIVAFVMIAFWVGKLGDHSSGDGVLDKGFNNIVLVGTSGFAYFANLVRWASVVDYVPERTLYPFFNFIYQVGLSAIAPPSQILIEEPIPYLTNVATFLEPLFSDGGLFFLIPGVVVLVVGSDLLGYVALRSRQCLMLFLWANLCFSNAFAFFVPRYNSTPLWFFSIFALVEGLIYYRREILPGIFLRAHRRGVRGITAPAWRQGAVP